MGADDEYRAVASAEDIQDQTMLDEKSRPISRSTYKKRSMAASILVGAIAGAGVMFVLSGIFGTRISNAAEAEAAAAVSPAPTVTVTATVEAPAALIPTAAPTVEGLEDTTADVQQPHEDKIEDCGNTPDEARAKGCVFDVMMQLWMPPACYDEPLSERYLLGGNWTWWADAEATRTLSLDEMRKGEHPVIYVIQDYHKQHCIFAWEKVVRALRNNGPVIEELISYDHVMHCKHTTLSKESENVRGVRAPTAYARCAMYDVWTRHLPANTVSTTD